MNEDKPEPIDWLRVLHRGFTLLRAVRGDDALVDDHANESKRGNQMKLTVEGIARRAVGCRAPEACTCVVCEETKNV